MKETPAMAATPIPIPAALAVLVEPFSEELLDTAIDAVWAGEPDNVPAAVGSFELTDDMRAEWALRKMASYALTVRDIDRQAADWIARIEQWHEEQRTRLDARIMVFQTALERYAVLAREKDDRAATITLPSGTLKTTRGKQPTVHIGNEEAFARWARTHLPPDQREKVIVDVPKVYVSAFRKCHLRVVDGVGGGPEVEYSPDGEHAWTRVPGVYVTQPEIRPSVSPDLSR